MKNVYFLHGVETLDAKNSIGLLSEYFHMPPFKSFILDYGWIPIVLANFLNFFILKKLKKEVVPGQICLGHSNGCALFWMLAHKIDIEGLILVNPALDNDVEFPASIRFIHIYWSPKDEISWLSQFVPFSAWGLMGQTGYRGKPDARVKQFDMEVGHMDIHEREVRAKWGPIMVQNIKNEYGFGNQTPSEK